jgi:DNA polymerase-1
MSEKKHLYIIDGNSLLYRAFFAIRNLRNKEGFPTNAIYGFISMVGKLVKEKKPEYIGVTFDVSKKTFRTDIFKDYKAQRKPMPNELVVQIPYIKEYLNHMNIKMLELENYEADDIMGTIAEKFKNEGIIVVLVTGDKDLFQLVNDSVFIYNPSKDIFYDREKVKEFFGVYPEQVIDLLSLEGDKSDNIPGVPGIGEITAKKLLAEFNSIENLLNNLDKIDKKNVQEKIKNNLDKLELSRKLVPIKKDLPLTIGLNDFIYKVPDEDKLIGFYEKFNFKSFLKNSNKKYKKITQKYETIISKDKLINLIKEIKNTKEFVFDTETNNSNPVKADILGISFCVKEGEAFYIPIKHQSLSSELSQEDIKNYLEPIFEDKNIKKTGHNIKYDIIVLNKFGINVKGVEWDTMILSYLLEPNRHSHKLDDLSMDYLGYKMISYKEIAGVGKKELTLDKIPLKKVSFYSCEDSDITFRLKEILSLKIEKAGLLELYNTLELPLIDVLVHLEKTGIRLDVFKLKQLSELLKLEIDNLKKEIYNQAGIIFNINSTQQLGDILFNKLKLPVIKKTKKSKAFSTSVDVLEELKFVHPIAGNILQYRQLAKLKSGYVDALPSLVYKKTGRIHTSYNQTVAATGRLSSSDPNLQNIPIKTKIGKKIREAFIPETGTKFLSADYSQVELRVLAHLAQDSALIKAFQKGEDIHSYTANLLFSNLNIPFEEKRRRAKIINFSIIYGKTAYTLSKELGVDRKEAQKFIDDYFLRYGGVKEFINLSIAEAEKYGFVKTIFGRKRDIPEIKSNNSNIKSHGERMAINTKVQGSAADLMKKAMIDVYNEIKKASLKTKIVLQVHDELVFEVPEKEEEQIQTLVKEKMETVYNISVPLVVDMKWGKNWAEA